MSQIEESKLESLKKANTILGLDCIKQDRKLVYCPPRVGSTSLVSSLRLSGSHIYKILHIHDEQMLRVVGSITNVKVMDIIQYNANIGREVFAIDLFRELERKMSEFLENLLHFISMRIFLKLKVIVWNDFQKNLIIFFLL